MQSNEGIVLGDKDNLEGSNKTDVARPHIKGFSEPKIIKGRGVWKET